ncbi:MAG: hypothetical protein MZW92_19960 [Comamonadaceae bacterium]|nr:hypothetical protein [Comamonadaceae bacterium]
MRQLLDKLEDDLEQGHLADADAADKRIEQSTHGAALPARSGAAPAAARRSRRLRGWARWGTDQVREHLIAEAEAPLAAEPDIEERARAVPALRQEWKRLDAHGPAAKVQWERFDSALSKAYEPVAEHRAQEMARHEAGARRQGAVVRRVGSLARGHRLGACRLQGVVQARRQEILVQWRAAPPAGFRDERQLRKRLDALVAAIDAPPGRGTHTGNRAARTTDRRRRSAARRARRRPRHHRGQGAARALARAGGRRGSAAARSSSSGSAFAPPATPCSRAATPSGRSRPPSARAASRRARVLLAGLEAVLAATDAGAIEAALAQFRSSWSRANRLSRPAEDRLAAAARDLMQQAEQRIEALRAEKHRARFDLDGAEGSPGAARSNPPPPAEGKPRIWPRKCGRRGTAWTGCRERPSARWRSDWPPPPRSDRRRHSPRAARPGRALHARSGNRPRPAPRPEPYGEARRERQLGSLRHRFKGGEAQTAGPGRPGGALVAIAAAPDPALKRMAGWVASAEGGSGR